MSKVCIKCHRELPEDSFYAEKNICKCCYKRWIRRKDRIAKGTIIKTVGDLIRELSSLPLDSNIVISDDVGVYNPVIVEFVRETFKGNSKFDNEEYNNTVIIV